MTTNNQGNHDGTKEMKEAGRDIGDAAEKVGHTIKEEAKEAGRDIRDLGDNR